MLRPDGSSSTFLISKGCEANSSLAEFAGPREEDGFVCRTEATKEVDEPQVEGLG